MPKLWNARDPNCPPDAVWIDRKSVYGNPFIMGRDGTRDEVCDKYDQWVECQGIDFSPLRGHDLKCWCAPERCHGNTVLRLANS